MFLSVVPRRPEPWAFCTPFRHVDFEEEDDCNFFSDMSLDDIVGPLTFLAASARPTSISQKQQHAGQKMLKSALKKRTSSEKADSPSESISSPAKKCRFEVQMDIEGFKPDELKVKLVDNWLTVEGSHESKDKDGGIVSRSFMRKCTIPDDVNMDEMTCNLNSTKGHMLISAPRKALQPPTQEKVIPITLQKADPTNKESVHDNKAPETEKAKDVQKPVSNESSSKDGETAEPTAA